MNKITLSLYANVLLLLFLGSNIGVLKSTKSELGASLKVSENENTAIFTTTDKLYYLISNSAYDLVRYNVLTSSVEQTRPNIINDGIPYALIYNEDTNNLHWYNDNFGSEHFYNIANSFISSTSPTQISSTAGILSNPRYITLDQTNNRLFATEIDFTNQITFIKSYDLDGNNASNVLQSFSSTFTSYSGIDLDDENNEMYWADPNTSSIFKASMTSEAGSQVAVVSGLTDPKDIALDLANRKVYWIENNGFGPYQIKSANIDGDTSSNNASIVTHYTITGSVDATELELSDGSDIFWSTTDFTTGKIFKGSKSTLNSSSEPTPIVTGEALFAPRLAYAPSSSTLSNDEFSNSTSIKVYPNPMLDRLIIESNNSSIESISIFDMLGKRVFKSQDYYNNSLNEVDVSNFLDGLYLLRIDTDRGLLTKKVFKK